MIIQLLALVVGVGIATIGLIVTRFAYGGALEWLWFGGLIMLGGIGVMYLPEVITRGPR